MTLTTVLIFIAVWSVVSLVAGLAIARWVLRDDDDA